MSRKALATTLSTLVFIAEAGCVTENVTTTCTVDGASYLTGGATAEEICRRFEERLAQAMTAAANGAEVGPLTIALELHERGSAEARIISQGPEGPVKHPTVSVAVMDRPMRQSDLDGLADSVAQLLFANQAQS